MVKGNECRICVSPNRVYIERLKESGKSYTEMARLVEAEFGERIYTRSFTVHFTKHVKVETAAYMTGLKEALQHEMELAPPTIAPLYALALRNLEGLEDTKPSQEHLIRALKAIHEITGLRLQQHMLVAFARERSKLAGADDSAGALPSQSTGGTEGSAGSRVVPLRSVRES
jgi:hypothetical protein